MVSSTFRFRYGRKIEKSDFSRASIQAGSAIAPARVISARSSGGTRFAFS